MKLTTLLLIAAAAYGQATINAPAVNLTPAGATALLAFMSGQQAKDAIGGAKQPSTTIAVALMPGSTSITVANGAGLGAGSTVGIGATEHVQVTARTANVLTVIRGFNGTIQTSHAIGVGVQELEHRTLNGLGRAMMVNFARQLVQQQRIGELNATASAQAAADALAAVQ